MPALQSTESGYNTIQDATNQLMTLVLRSVDALNTADDDSAVLLARSDSDGMHHRSTGLWTASSVDAAGILAAQQRRQIQIVAASMASVSIVAAMCAIYWFWMMRRNYRRDLVLMLILGDFYKSLWYLIHGSVNFARSQVKSEEPFCQVSGFMLQTGLQSCDIAILFISMHMALQIFPPSNSILGHDGLYKVRHWVFAIWVLLPCFTAALAFINPNGAYQAQGAWCWLPIRPFWYRLALSWVPRYLIWLYIMWVAIRIYTHVGYEFRVFGQERDRSSSADLSAQSSAERGAIEKHLKERRSQIITSEKNVGFGIAPEDFVPPPPPATETIPNASDKSLSPNAGRRMSLPAWHSPFGGTSTLTPPADDTTLHPNSRSTPTSRRGSRQIAPGVFAEDFIPPPNPNATHPRGSITSLASLPRSLDQAALPSISEARASAAASLTSSGAATSLTTHALRQRRRAIQRQLRILFIYPVVYMLLWLIPFVAHCLSYSDHYAQHPVFPISLLSSFCQCFMGFADVCVFCWRERPWRHVPGGDGTFLGSFAFWRGARDEWAYRRPSRAPNAIARQPASTTGLLGSLKRWSLSRKGSSPASSGSLQRPGLLGGGGAHRRTPSGARQTREAELAHERLRLEREDYERNARGLGERRESAVAEMQGRQQAQAGRKEWFDGTLNLSAEEVGEGDGRGKWG